MRRWEKKGIKKTNNREASLEAVSGETNNNQASQNGTPKKLDYPTLRQLQAELKRERYRINFWRTLRSTIYTLVTVSAFAILIAVLLLPVLQIYGRSMKSTLNGGDIVFSLKNAEPKVGDIVAFYYNNNILVKRAIASSGEWVDIDKDGNVYVNQQLIDEPYLDEKALGECNIEMPYQVPEGKLFVMGDNRAVSIDSRNTAVGCISEEQIVGKIVFRIWPLNRISVIK